MERATDGILGREPELAAARAFLDGLDDGPRALILEGEAGIGKTAVWRAVLAEAQARGVRVLRCVAEQTEAQLSFVGLGDLVGALADYYLPALPSPQREALEVALLRRASPSGRAADPKAVGVGLRSLLAEAERGRPLLVAVDDVQWLDAPTAHALAFVARRLAGRRVGFVVTLRAPAAADDALGLERALGAERFERVRIGPLAAGTLRELLDQRLGFAYPRPTLLRIARLSDGNPLFALEIARALGPAPALDAGAALPVPDSLRDLVASHVAALPDAAREALLAAAALSHPTVDAVERAASPAGLLAAEESGLLTLEGRRLAFAHPLYAAAVYGTAASGRRRELHDRLAGLAADREERVRHRALAAAGPDEDVAAALEEAAADARERGAWETAGELLEQARDLTPAERPDAARLRAVRAAEHHIHAGDRPRGRALLQDLLAHATEGPIRGDALRLLAEIHYNEASLRAAGTLLEEALEHAGDLADQVAIELNLCYVRANHRSDFAGADVHATRALGHAVRAGEPGLLAEALASRAMVDFLLGRGVDWGLVDRALALDDPGRTLPLQLRPAAIAACLRLWSGRHAEARAELTALRDAAGDSGDESDLAYALCWLAYLETTAGELEAAVGHADDAVAQAGLAGSELNRAWGLAQRAMARANRGDAHAAREDVAETAAICTRLDASNPMIWAAGGLAQLELSLGDPAAAWTAIAPLMDGLAAGVEPLPFCVPSAVEALVGLGRLDEAEPLLAGFESDARRLDRAAALAAGGRARALLLAERGDLAGAQEALEIALAEHARVEMPLELGRTLLVQGQVRRRRRQKRATRASLEQALALFESAGAALWAQRARDELARLDRHARRDGELTPAEGRVAGLAAQGMSNKEIARSLYVTVHTVEVHLSKAFRKLDVRSRTQLASRLAVVEV